MMQSGEVTSVASPLYHSTRSWDRSIGPSLARDALRKYHRAARQDRIRAMESAASIMPKPANALVRIADDGRPWLRAFRCGDCGAVVAEATLACRACGSRTPPAAFESSTQGTLFTWAKVHRSFPGVAVPFVSVIVDLDDGLTLKGTLRDVADGALEAGLPLTLVFDDAGGAKDAHGAGYVGFHFVPSTPNDARAAT